MLISQITNQMIASCREYVEDCGKSPLWKQDHGQLSQRLKACVDLNKAYQIAYHETRKSTREDQKMMKFSEIQIFGDFNEFVTRIEAIQHIIDTLEKFGVLRNIFFEGVDRLLLHYNKISSFISTRNYDYLDPENTDFIQDFEYFGKEIATLQEAIQVAYNLQCSRSTTVLSNLRYMMKLERGKVPAVGQDGRYRRLVGYLRLELDEITNVYNSEANNPRIERDMPPYAGRPVATINCPRKSP